MSVNELGINSFGAETLQGFALDNVEAGQRLGGKKSNQFVRFYEENEIVTKAAVDENGNAIPGKFINEPVTRLRIQVIQGDKNDLDTYAEDRHKEQFWPQYKHFMENRGEAKGTPLASSSFVPPAALLELKLKGVTTLEQLAECTDLIIERIPAGIMLRERARAEVEAMIKNSQSIQVQMLQKQLEELRAQNAAFAVTLEESEREARVLASQNKELRDTSAVKGVEEIEEEIKKKGKNK